MGTPLIHCRSQSSWQAPISLPFSSVTHSDSSPPCGPVDQEVLPPLVAAVGRGKAVRHQPRHHADLVRPRRAIRLRQSASPVCAPCAPRAGDWPAFRSIVPPRPAVPALCPRRCVYRATSAPARAGPMNPWKRTMTIQLVPLRLPLLALALAPSAARPPARRRPPPTAAPRTACRPPPRRRRRAGARRTGHGRRPRAHRRDPGAGGPGARLHAPGARQAGGADHQPERRHPQPASTRRTSCAPTA